MGFQFHPNTEVIHWRCVMLILHKHEVEMKETLA